MQRELPVRGTLGIEPDNTDTPPDQLSDEEVGTNVLLVGNDKDCGAAQNPFWSSPVSRSAFLVAMPVAASIAGS